MHGKRVKGLWWDLAKDKPNFHNTEEIKTKQTRKF